METERAMGEIRDFKSNKGGKPAREASPRRLAAIIAGDISGYSRLMEIDEEGTHGRVKRIERSLIEPSIAEHHGRLVKTTGDGFIAIFDSPVEAVRCGIVIQQHIIGSSIGLVSILATSSSKQPTFTAMASILLRVARALPSLARFTSLAPFTSRSRTSWFADMSCSEIARSRTSPIRSGSTACFRIRPPLVGPENDARTF